MIRKLAFVFAVALTASIAAQVIAVSEASAGGKNCNYTTADKQKGYRC